MSPFSVTVDHVPDRELGALLARLSGAGFASPIVRYVGADSPSDGPAPVGSGSPDLPEEWRLLREREGESYRWPKRRDDYAPYRVFMGTTRAEGAVQIGLGETIRENAWGRDRKYVVAFLSGGSPQHPLVEFVAADDFEDTRELVAVVRGSDGGRRMYGVGDKLRRSTRNASEPRSTTSGSGIRAPGTRSSSSLARTTTPRCSTTRSSRAGGATGRRHASVVRMFLAIDAAF